MTKKLFRLYCFSFVVSILPIVILLIVKWDDYVKSVPAGGLKLTIAGIIASVVLLFKVTGHLNIKSHFVWYVGLALFFWLIKSMANDLSLVFVCAAVGDGVDEIFFQTAIKKERQRIAMDKQADVIVDKLGKAGNT